MRGGVARDGAVQGTSANPPCRCQLAADRVVAGAMPRWCRREGAAAAAGAAWGTMEGGEGRRREGERFIHDVAVLQGRLRALLGDEEGGLAQAKV